MTGVSPIRERFGGEDVWGHTEWQGFGGPIIFSVEYFADGEKNVKKENINEMMARVLVHEASHRWGDTTDVMYKNSTFGKKASLHDKAVLRGMDTGSDKFRAKKLFGEAAQIAMAGVEREGKMRTKLSEPKPLVGMKGNKVGDVPIEDKRWLENADSYAWFARRMWKYLLKG